MTAYYNENDPHAAEWLRELIKAGLIAPGYVDERSIEDVTAGDIAGYTQCHWFAGIGIWSHALREAGWPDDKPVWTASCPCPPFSTAGKKKPCPKCDGRNPLPHAFRTGFFRCTNCGHDWYADGRHLWPDLYRLVRECRPGTLLGEQVAGKNGNAWGDVVQSTLELEGYTFGRVPFAACGLGAPNIRRRLYWVANMYRERCDRKSVRLFQLEPRKAGNEAARRCGSGWMANSFGQGLQERERDRGIQCEALGPCKGKAVVCRSNDRRMADPKSPGRRIFDPSDQRKTHAQVNPSADTGQSPHDGQQRPASQIPGAVNGFWRDADWLFCRDGRWRPVKPGTFPLVDGYPGRVAALRGIGNSLNAQAAAAFVEACIAEGVGGF